MMEATARAVGGLTVAGRAAAGFNPRATAAADVNRANPHRAGTV